MMTPAHLMCAGLAREHLGLALWQADGSGPEPARVGHSFPAPIRTITTHYYIASRDYDGIDPASLGGVKAVAAVGFESLRATLAKSEFTVENLVIALPLMTPGADKEGEDWIYRDQIETRQLRPQANVVLRLAGRPMLGFAVPRITLTEDYTGAKSFADVRLSCVSDPVMPLRIAPAGVADVHAAAQAFLADLAGQAVRLVVEEIRILPDTFTGHGRVSGKFAEIPRARVEVVAK